MASAPDSALSAALRSSWESTAALSLVAGIATHISIQPFEIDDKGWHIFFLYPITGSLILAAYTQIAGFGILQAILRATLISCTFNVGLVGSMLLYRAFFHRLRRFPGPFVAKLSRFYAMRHAATACQNNIVTQQLHEQYGDFVRVGPREISINRQSAIKPVYEPPTRTTRSPWYAQVSNDVTKISLNSTRIHQVHKQRKKAWERGLGSRALAVYQPRVQSKADLLLSRIESNKANPIDMTMNGMFYSFDVMGDVGLSKDFRMLESGDEHPAIRGVHDSMTAIGVLGTVPWLLSMLSKIPGAAGGYLKFTAWCHQQLQEKRRALADEKALHNNQDPRDIMSWLLKAEEEGDNSAPPGEMAIQEDARLLIIAGSDTTSAGLVNALYYLIKYPKTYEILRQSIKKQFPGGVSTWTYEGVRANQYLDYVIHETLRLKPSVPGGLARVTPAQGLYVDDTFIPGNTVVSVPTYTIQRDSRYWDDPLEFKPERWDGISTEKVPWLVFTRGQWACPGRQLAYMELRVALSRIALEYRIAFNDPEEADHFDRDIKDTFTLTVPSLHIRFSTDR